MNIEGSKIKALIDHYGQEKGYPEKSYIAKFCEDFDVNYIQWSAYTRNTQKAGIKIIYFLMDIFPNLNMNWLLKEDEKMFLTKKSSLKQDLVEEGGDKSLQECKVDVSNSEIMSKLEKMHNDLKKIYKI